ncbi:hypothetical protein Cni_G22364 [Canna indica]|uniref:Uncharacterized protein n=1 Tax=Canna indica TaxID=4628 RepID=A0AAQ3KSC1_9LILI|nr:hypothetical protein Cni_G22364 [Canna indica]
MNGVDSSDYESSDVGSYDYENSLVAAIPCFINDTILLPRRNGFSWLISFISPPRISRSRSPKRPGRRRSSSNSRSRSSPPPKGEKEEEMRRI